MELRLDGIEVDCVIGERDYERTMVQRLVVDVALEVPDRAAETDELSDAVDYVALSGAIRSALVEAKCRLVERAALVSARVCMSNENVMRADVMVAKSGAVPGLRRACARCRLER